mmetsp:Transcript_24835/g.59105  ORF Transcript_24835/g.59105 Transcript_24835/m.59105 type:complete len:178 (+) Transcript_24835:140-673(+)|eukprot:CAMPEP_0177716786 /NCGR_PEP_ID=MMETSP0484_2-20121128/14688_1 /TAXON_ID=354590 /ORGANISM="Rhodomonas lens, Strain RHODO" /LENGTH=177 /DNA_ID=CAMNT_0019228825 /DNA_START=114 /DNA_END=647 /DNA_ORIENTATION=-
MAEANADETVGQGERQEAPEMMESITKDELSPKRKYKFTGYVGASPSSLAAMAKGRQYFVDPYTPFTPRPENLNTRDYMVGPPLATYRSNHWVTQTSPAYIPKRLQNHRVPRTPPENKLGFPARAIPRPSTVAGDPKYMVDGRGHLLQKFRKPGRAAFPNVEEVGAVSWTFSRMGYV